MWTFFLTKAGFTSSHSMDAGEATVLFHRLKIMLSSGRIAIYDADGNCVNEWEA